MQRNSLIYSIFLGLLGAATLNVAIQSLLDPQSAMNLVQVDLGDNLTARNSIRAAYGGVNLLLGGFWLLAAFRRSLHPTGTLLAALYTGGFAVGRIVSWLDDGAPGAFAQQWLVVESVFCFLAVLLTWRARPQAA